MIQALFPFCTVTWRASNYVSGQRRGIKTGNESRNYDINVVAFDTFVTELTVIE